MGSDVEFTEDLCYTCPKCGSNAYEVLPVDKDKKEGE
jgi:Zn finger protein HypA/HybF involved in hydrogenase expression